MLLLLAVSDLGIRQSAALLDIQALAPLAHIVRPFAPGQSAGLLIILDFVVLPLLFHHKSTIITKIYLMEIDLNGNEGPKPRVEMLKIRD